MQQATLDAEAASKKKKKPEGEEVGSLVPISTPPSSHSPTFQLRVTRPFCMNFLVWRPSPPILPLPIFLLFRTLLDGRMCFPNPLTIQSSGSTVLLRDFNVNLHFLQNLVLVTCKLAVLVVLFCQFRPSWGWERDTGPKCSSHVAVPDLFREKAMGPQRRWPLIGQIPFPVVSDHFLLVLGPPKRFTLSWDKHGQLQIKG